VSGEDAQGRVTVGVRINTLIVWLWIGGAVMALGTILAIAPRLRRPKRPVDPASDEPPHEKTPDVLVGVSAALDADGETSGAEAAEVGSEAGVDW
jgi:hypothetical protein